MEPFTKTGGARIGWVNASWPLARLSATHDKLTVAARMLGTYTFNPEQVCAVERYVLIPLVAWGVRVRHCVPEYPQRIIFWSFASPDSLLRGIQSTGFVPSGPTSAIPLHQGIPVRWSAIIVSIIVWNVLFMLPFVGRSASSVNGLILLMPLIAVFLLSIGTLTVPTLQRFILKPDRSVG